MSPILLISILLIVGIALIVLDLFVPSAGALSILGVLAIFSGIGFIFTIDKWMGLVALAAAIVLTPFAIKLGIEFWQRTSMGRRVTLVATTPTPEHEPVRVGDVGRTVTELRPMGEVEIGMMTVQARSGGEIIRPGTQIEVTEYHDGVATVRKV